MRNGHPTADCGSGQLLPFSQFVESLHLIAQVDIRGNLLKDLLQTGKTLSTLDIKDYMLLIQKLCKLHCLLLPSKVAINYVHRPL